MTGRPDTMSVREWLGRARSIDREIEALLSAKAETRDRLLKITQNYSKDGAQSTRDPHKYDKLAELDYIINQKVDSLINVKAEITEAISMLHDGRQRVMLFDYYVRLMSLEATAAHMGYSYAQVKRIRAKGFYELSKLLKDELE